MILQKVVSLNNTMSVRSGYKHFILQVITISKYSAKSLKFLLRFCSRRLRGFLVKYPNKRTTNYRRHFLKIVDLLILFFF